jgi:hypothetical protein
MKRKTSADLHTQLIYARVREYDNDFRVRMQAPKDAERLEKAYIRAERREQRDGEVS